MSADVIRTPRRVLPTLIAALLATAYLIIQPTGADLPAQLLRARLFGAEGFGIWSNWWYGGHYLPGYSVLYPPLASALTPQLLAAAATVITAAAFEALAHQRYGERAWLGASWLAAATVVELLSGRLTFAFGLAGTALTALAIQRRRPGLAACAAFLTALASPIAGLFAALAGITAALSSRDPRTRRAGELATIAALAPVAALAVAFPTPGSQPFAFSTLWPILAIAIVLLIGLPTSERTISTATGLYALGCLAAYLMATPVGANAARLGELLAGPLAALLMFRADGDRHDRRTRMAVLLVLALPLTYLQVHDAVTDLQHGSRSPSDTAAYYRPLIRFLDTQPGARQHTFRIEVPFTEGHWEAYRLAPLFPLARGWERQLDIGDNPLFYSGPLTMGTYRTWLHQLAVRYVAVADAPPDYSAHAELALIDRDPPYLRLVATLPHWRVYRVLQARPIASGAARLTYMGPDTLTLRFRHPGTAYIRVRWSPYWQLEGIQGCVAPDGAFMSVEARSSGAARLAIDFSLDRIGASSPRCNHLG